MMKKSLFKLLAVTLGLLLLLPGCVDSRKSTDKNKTPTAATAAKPIATAASTAQNPLQNAQGTVSIQPATNIPAVAGQTPVAGQAPDAGTSVAGQQATSSLVSDNGQPLAATGVAGTGTAAGGATSADATSSNLAAASVQEVVNKVITLSDRLMTVAVKPVDWDQDGKMDILVAAREGVKLYMNKGNDQFEEKLVYQPVDGAQIEDVFGADVNKDSVPDVVVISRGDEISVPLPRKKKHFLIVRWSRKGGTGKNPNALFAHILAQRPESPEPSEVTGDSDGTDTATSDIAKTSAAGTAVPKSAIKDASVEELQVIPILNSVSYNAASKSYNHAWALADLNGDSALDLKFGWWNYINKGDGHFEEKPFQDHQGKLGNCVGIADLGVYETEKYPGLVDCIQARKTMEVFWYRSHEKANQFTVTTKNMWGFISGHSRKGRTNYPQTDFFPVDYGDANGDGLRDVLAKAKIRGRESTATATDKELIVVFQRDWRNWEANTLQLHVRTAIFTDYNSDGQQDIVCGGTGTSGKVVLLLNQGGGLFAPAKILSPTGYGNVNTLAAVDLNGDNLPDIMVGSFGGKADVIMNTGLQAQVQTAAAVGTGTGVVQSNGAGATQLFTNGAGVSTVGFTGPPVVASPAPSVPSRNANLLNALIGAAVQIYQVYQQKPAAAPAPSAPGAPVAPGTPAVPVAPAPTPQQVA